MSQTIFLTSDVVPVNMECIISNSNWQALVSLTRVVLPDGTKIIIGNTTPAPEDRDAIWYRRNADGTPDRVYLYAAGAWLAPHPDKDFVGKIVMWHGLEANITTLDGGEPAAISPITGPFWERATEMDGRMPLGPGTLQPSGTVVGTTGLTGGADQVTLTNAQLPNNPFAVNNLNGIITAVSAGGDYTINTDAAGAQHKTGQWQGNGDPHDNMPPYLTTWFLRKTARLYYRAP